MKEKKEKKKKNAIISGHYALPAMQCAAQTLCMDQKLCKVQYRVAYCCPQMCNSFDTILVGSVDWWLFGSDNRA